MVPAWRPPRSTCLRWLRQPQRLQADLPGIGRSHPTAAVAFPSRCRGRGNSSRTRYRSERPVPDQRLRAITFVVVNRFSKTRRISRALAVAHPRARGAYASPPASFSSGLRPALVRCQVAQGPRSRAGFAARGGGGGVGMVLGRASARLEVRQPCSSRWICDFSFSLHQSSRRDELGYRGA